MGKLQPGDYLVGRRQSKRILAPLCIVPLSPCSGTPLRAAPGPRPAAWYEEDHVVWGCFLAYVSGCAYRLARFNLDDKVPVLHPPHSTTFKSRMQPDDPFFPVYL